MRVLHRLLAHREFISATESAQRVLKLLGHVRLTLRLDRASGGRKRPISATCRKTSWSDIGSRVPHRHVTEANLESGRSVFGGLVQVKTPSPTKEYSATDSQKTEALYRLRLESPRRRQNTSPHW
jgi:hypothetical protein